MKKSFSLIAVILISFTSLLVIASDYPTESDEAELKMELIEGQIRELILGQLTWQARRLGLICKSTEKDILIFSGTEVVLTDGTEYSFKADTFNCVKPSNGQKFYIFFQGTIGHEPRIDSAIRHSED